MSGKLSSHQMGIVEVLSQMRLLGEVPRVTFIGIEPQDISPWGMELSPAIRDKVPALVKMVLNELEQRGFTIIPSAPKSGLKNVPMHVLK
jgi:hydrogenase maturation protease